MEQVILIEGNVRHSLTLDPSVWIFDDRKIDLNSYFEDGQKETAKEDEDNEEAYIKKIAAQFDKEMLGEKEPPKKTPFYKEKEKMLTGSFGMPLEPFLLNAEPKKDAKEIVVVTKEGKTFPFPIEEGLKLILGFSKDGKPLKDDGPVHVYVHDGSNKDNPIRHVQKIIVK